MAKSFISYVPNDVESLRDLIASLVLGAPKCTSATGYFPEVNIDSEFTALAGGLSALREALGQERYDILVGMADQAKALFVAAPDAEADEVWAGRNLLLEMDDMLDELPAGMSPSGASPEPE
jgi:hypothetical protein